MVTSSSTRTRHSFADDVREIDEFFEVLVARIDPDAVPLCEVTDSVDRARRRRAARRGGEDVAGPAGRGGGPMEAGRVTAPRPSSWPVSGTSMSAAKNQLETSKKVRKLPATAKAMRTGRLSAAKARGDRGRGGRRTRGGRRSCWTGAEDAPLAEHQGGVSRSARAKDRDAAHERIREGAVVQGVHRRRRRLELARPRDRSRPAPRSGPRTARSSTRCSTGPCGGPARAVRGVRVRRAHRARPRVANGTTAEPTTQTPNRMPAPVQARRTRPKRTPAKHLAIIRLDHAALVRGAVEGDEICEIPGSVRSRSPSPASCSATRSSNSSSPKAWTW